MFAKLLKHEWRATRGVVGLLCVIILISGIVLGGISYYLVSVGDRGNSFVVNVVCVLLLMAGLLAIGVCGAASVFVVIWRFYKGRFTDEGYLTFTLPVNNHQILLSSILNSVRGVLIVVLTCFAAVGIAAGFYLTAIGQDQTIIWADVWAAWEGVWQQLWESFVKNAGQFALLGFSAVTGAVSELILLMLAVTIGALMAKKHKILAAVGVYYGIGLIKSVVFSSFALSATTTRDVNILLAMPGVTGLVLAIFGYFLMHWLISKRLNLT